MSLSVGARIGPYLIDGKLGAGGMGEVYRARDTRLDRLVAIKVLPRDNTADASARERFDREARTISGLDHPNICTLYDVGEVDGAPFLVMQYLNGETLAERTTRGPMPLVEVRRIGLELASGLLYAHERHILHRDLKPHNVMLLADGRTKLLDFGIAQRDFRVTTAETEAALTGAGSILGTLEYMSPEQLSGRNLDVRSDIFSLGLVLSELITGHHPFGGDTPPLTASAILSGTMRPMTTGAAGALAPILRKMLARAPDDRYPSLAPCIEDLRALDLDAQIQPVSGEQPPVVAPSWRRRVALGAALLLVVVFGVGRWLLAGRTDPAPARSASSVATVAPVVQSRLTYWLEVQPAAGDPTFASLGDHPLPAGARFRVHLEAAPGQIYLLSDDPSPAGTNATGLSIVFTGPITTQLTTEDWFLFTGNSTDHLWMVWSAAPVDELAAIAPLYNARDRGIVTDPMMAERVRALLNRAEAKTPSEHGDPAGPRATVESNGTVIAHRLELQHG